MRRGDIVVASEKGSFSGKPRPWLVIQADLFLDAPISITVVMISASTLPADFRVPVLPSLENGVLEPSFVVCDKIATMRATSIDKLIGRIDPGTMERVDSVLRRWLDL